MGRSKIFNLLNSEDVNNTLRAVKKIGVSYIKKKNYLEINGVGINGFKIKKRDYFGNDNYLKNKINDIIENINIYFNNRRMINAKCIPIYIKERILKYYNSNINIY